MLLDEIPEGLWEVDFFENSSEKNIIIPAADGQLEKSNPGCSDMDSGHSPDSKCASLASRVPFLFNILYNICIFIGILPNISGNIYQKPSLLSPCGGGVIYIYIGNQRLFHDWAPEKRSQRATTGKLLGIALRVFF